ncbi:integrase arm-type DNA-binding domain-containing protein [Halomonas janggokensis]|uniref:Integrase arm-type DNA-binding domain-containing protein n=1 Tax=Vreelandella janggokensis TaxID=370767 RepID=A0ABT4IT58_9GAMM|nr:integrase arm-type DNA-binding domain-containing protein [Halomonas janggokensis]MCZ0926423.1 integrase arm-type DNA-binding domain-containing protein [Halomonas janggokensis]MCZ0928961.1 integrase arm-type DNA-binding domain-containing protein [Halomonas janggokensis]
MKRSAIKRRPLADTVLSKLEPEEKEYRESYGVDRLYFVVASSGRKRWEVRYKKPVTGRWAWMGIGTYPDVTAKAARAEAQDVAKKVAEGIDPILKRREEKTGEGRMGPFEVTANAWLEHRISEGHFTPGTAYQARTMLDNDILPMIGKIPVSQVSRADCARVVSQIEKRGALNRAKKCRIWLLSIFDYAHALDRCDANPAASLRVSSKAPKKSKPFPFLREHELPEFLRSLRATSSGPLVTAASWITLYLASRPGMVRFMEWPEINLKEATWHLKAEKMKSRRDYLTPLPHQVVTILKSIRPLAGEDGQVFPNRNSKRPVDLAVGGQNSVLAVGSINKCLSRMGYAGRMTGHGSRHTAKTLLSEHGWPRDWSEMQLAHALPGLESTYNQAVWIKQRRTMMQWYADYLDALELGMTDEQVEEFDDQVLLPGGQRFTEQGAIWTP